MEEIESAYRGKITVGTALDCNGVSWIKKPLTPLCLACRANKVECAKALVEGGADPSMVIPAFGKSALEIARTNKRTAILALFGDQPVEAEA